MDHTSHESKLMLQGDTTWPHWLSDVCLTDTCNNPLKYTVVLDIILLPEYWYIYSQKPRAGNLLIFMRLVIRLITLWMSLLQNDKDILVMKNLVILPHLIDYTRASIIYWSRWVPHRITRPGTVHRMSTWKHGILYLNQFNICNGISTIIT